MQYATYFNQIQQQEMYEIQAWFRSVDRDGSGSISSNEIANSTHTHMERPINIISGS